MFLTQDEKAKLLPARFEYLTLTLVVTRVKVSETLLFSTKFSNKHLYKRQRINLNVLDGT